MQERERERERDWERDWEREAREYNLSEEIVVAKRAFNTVLINLHLGIARLNVGCLVQLRLELCNFSYVDLDFTILCFPRLQSTLIYV